MPIVNCQLLSIGNRKSEISVFVLVLVFVQTLLFHDVQLDGIESNNFQVSPTFFTRHYFALVRVQINVDISIAFRASSGRHFLFLPRKGEGRDTPRVGRASLPDKQPNQSTRERWNLQYSFIQIVGPRFITFLCRKYFSSQRIAGLKFSHKKAHKAHKRFLQTEQIYLCALCALLWLIFL